MNMPVRNAAMNLRLSSPLAMPLLRNVLNAKALFKRYIQMLALSSKALVFIKQTQESLRKQRLLQPQLRQLLQLLQLLQHPRTISRDVVVDLLQFPHLVLNHHLHADQSHLASLSAKFSDRS